MTLTNYNICIYQQWNYQVYSISGIKKNKHVTNKRQLYRPFVTPFKKILYPKTPLYLILVIILLPSANNTDYAVPRKRTKYGKNILLTEYYPPSSHCKWNCMLNHACNQLKIKLNTFQSTVCQDDFFSSAPWAAIIENSVCPALLRTAGLWSTQRSLRRPYRSIHNASNAGMPSPLDAAWLEPPAATAFDTRSPTSGPPTAGRSVHMRDRLWEK